MCAQRFFAAPSTVEPVFTEVPEPSFLPATCIIYDLNVCAKHFW